MVQDRKSQCRKPRAQKERGGGEVERESKLKLKSKSRSYSQLGSVEDHRT